MQQDLLNMVSHYIGPSRQKINLILLHANNKDADQHFTFLAEQTPCKNWKQYFIHMRGSREGVEVRTPLENQQAIGFLSNAGPYPPENLKANQTSIQC